MKTLRFVLPLALAACALPVSAILAAEEEAPKEQNRPPVRERAARNPNATRPAANPLTPAEAEKLKAAMEAAKTDTAYLEAQKELAAARKKMLDALKTALVKADPEVEPILKKIGDNPQAILNQNTPATRTRNFQLGERGQRGQQMGERGQRGPQGERGQRQGRPGFQGGERPAPPPPAETAPVPPAEED